MDIWSGFWKGSCIGLYFVGAYLDYISGVEVASSLFYILPIFLAAWYGGRRYGLFFAFACAGAWYLMDMVVGRHDYRMDAAAYWNTLVRLSFFTILAMTISLRKKAEDELIHTQDVGSRHPNNHKVNFKKKQQCVFRCF